MKLISEGKFKGIYNKLKKVMKIRILKRQITIDKKICSDYYLLAIKSSTFSRVLLTVILPVILTTHEYQPEDSFVTFFKIIIAEKNLL